MLQTTILIRLALPEEQKDLESLQMRASLAKNGGVMCRNSSCSRT